MVTIPKPFDMNKIEDIKRWFREMKGYLRTGYGEHKTFVNMGTDLIGRRYAYDGFIELEQALLKSNKEIQELKGVQTPQYTEIRNLKSQLQEKDKEIAVNRSEVYDKMNELVKEKDKEIEDLKERNSNTMSKLYTMRTTKDAYKEQVMKLSRFETERVLKLKSKLK